jgi:hypothetical protein
VVRWNTVPHAGNNSGLAELSEPFSSSSALRLCTEQAALATDEDTRSTLLGMAAEYRQQAERPERDQPERD